MIEVDSLFYRYPNSKNYALKDISFSVGEGEIVLIAGPTGSGKSTLGYVITGIVQSFVGGELKGSVRVLGKEIKSINDIFPDVGYMFQSFENQLLSFNVFDELAISAINAGISKREVIKRVSEVLDILKIERLAKKYVYNLSFGEMQKVVLGSLLVLRPKILILDEPFSHLDEESSKTLINLLEKLRNNGLTILVLEHRVKRLVNLCDKVLLISGGKKLFFGNVDKSLALMNELGLRLRDIPKIKSKVGGGEKLLECKNLWIDRDGVKGVIKNLSFFVKGGEIVVFYGPNGAGKTTLSLHLIGAIPRKFGSCSMKKPISMVFQNPEKNFLYDNVFDEVYRPAKNFGLGAKAAKDFALDLLNRFNLIEYQDFNPRHLSKGQQMRLAIASALASRPKILIIDEPTFGQDYNGLISILETLNIFREEFGLGVIINTNDEEFAKAIGDRIYHIDRGQISKIYGDEAV